MGYKPYDAIIVTPEGDTAHVELKYSKGVLRYGDVRPNQHKALRAISERGGDAYVVTYYAGSWAPVCQRYEDFTRQFEGL